MTKQQIDVAALRKRLGLSRKELALAVGLKAATTVCRWENGTNEPRGSALLILRQLLEQSNKSEAA